jgi:predicted nucleic acid-binding Zn ribbon protein
MPSKFEKTCEECGKLIHGRIDKKFCSDQCRTTFNNRLNKDITRYIRNTNHTLRKNRRILTELNPRGKSRVRRDKLLEKGFDFSHFTSTYISKEGARYFYCYEQGYLPITIDSILLVVKKEF